MAKLYYKDKSLSNGGQEGKSAFEVWKSTFPESEQDTLTISDFLNDIRGDSVFDVWKDSLPTSEQETATMSDFLSAIGTEATVSTEEGNIIEQKSDGIYVGKSENSNVLDKLNVDSNGKLTYNGEPVKGEGGLETEEIDNGDGTKKTVINLGGGTTIETVYDGEGNPTSTKIGDIVVKGTDTTTTTETSTDGDGNTVNTTTTITNTPDGKKVIETVETTNATTGDKIIIETTTSGNPNNGGLGIKDVTITKKDSTGNETEKIQETNLTKDGESIYLSTEEVDNMFDNMEW